MKKKARKYKYKYLKLKEEYFGEGGGMFDFLKNEKTIIPEINKELEYILPRIVDIKKIYEENCEKKFWHKSDIKKKGQVFGALYRKFSICHTEMYDIKTFIMNNYSLMKDYKYPKIVKYFFNMSGKWKMKLEYNHAQNYENQLKHNITYEDDNFNLYDLKTLKKKFPKHIYPYYENLIKEIENNGTLQMHATISLQQFYEVHIKPIVKNLDIYLIVMYIKKLFTKYKNKLKDKYPKIYTLVDDLVLKALYNEINSPLYLLKQIIEINRIINPELILSDKILAAMSSDELPQQESKVNIIR
jgi:hypothetical protein